VTEVFLYCPIMPSVTAILEIISRSTDGTLKFLGGYKDGLAGLETICKIGALIVGGIWAWKGFIRNRLRFPSATLEHVITSWSDENKTFLHVKVRVTNTGNILIKLSKGKTWVEKLTPLPSKVRKALRTGAPIAKRGQEIDWSLIEKRELAAADAKEIEPKESDELNFDFVIDNRISRVLVYTHLENEVKGLRKKIGWNLTSIYVIESDNNLCNSSRNKETKESCLALIRRIFLSRL